MVRYRHCHLPFVFLAFASAASGNAATIHVAARTQGAGDGSAASPYASVEEALNAAQASDTIVVAGGNYSCERRLRIDKAGLKLIGVSGQRPVLRGSLQGEDSVIVVVADNVLLQDLTIEGGYYGIKVDVDELKMTRGVTIRNCQIGSTAADCIKTFNADDLRIENCRIGPSGLVQRDNAEGIDVIGSIGVTIRGCLVEQTATNGIYLKGGTRNGVVERCFLRRLGNAGILLGQDTDPEYMRDGARYEAIGCTARNNIIVDANTAGLGTYSSQGANFWNNTLVDVAREGQAAFWVVTNGREVPSEKVSFRNNIVIVGGERPAMFFKDAADLPESESNLFFARKGELRFVRESSDPGKCREWTFAQWREETRRDQRSLAGDPQLDQNQYRPVLGSPVIGAGQAVTGLDDDYFGVRRKGGRDIGAVAATQQTALQSRK